MAHLPQKHAHLLPSMQVFYYGHVHSCERCLWRMLAGRLPWAAQHELTGSCGADERTAPVNNFIVDLCGSVHITIGAPPCLLALFALR